MHVYKAELEEGASTTQAVIVEGSLPRAQDPAQPCCLPERSLVRQRYIVAKGQKEVVSRPPAAVGEGPLKYPLEDQQLRVESQATVERCHNPIGKNFCHGFPGTRTPDPTRERPTWDLKRTKRT